MEIVKQKRAKRLKRKQSVRKKIIGSPDRPRLTVYRSNKYIYAQIIDDLNGKTIVTASSLEKELRDKDKKGSKKDTEKAKSVGKIIAQRALKKKIKQVVFDRNGYIYHGRVKALADSAREAGLKF